MSDLNTFDGVTEWVEAAVLPAIEQNYTRNTSSFAIALIALDNDGSILSEITPRPIVVEDSTLKTEEDQRRFSDMVRDALTDYAAAGVIMIAFAPTDTIDDRVIVSLEHKAGRINWIATGSGEKIGEFQRDDEYDWESEFQFSDMLPICTVN